MQVDRTLTPQTYNNIHKLYPRERYTIDPRLTQIAELKLSPSEATMVLIALKNVRKPHLTNLSTKAYQAYNLMNQLKDDHRSFFSSILSCGTTERFKLGIGYLKLVAAEKSAVVVGQGSTLIGGQRQYIMFNYLENVPQQPIARFDWDNITGFDRHSTHYYSGETRDIGDGPHCTNIVYHGRGTYFFDNGTIYEGNWEYGKRTGRGTYFYADGDIYQGQVIDGEFSGQGTYYYSDGSIYQGEFRKDKQCGKGTYVNKFNGSIYTGEMKDDAFNGEGVMTFRNDLRYQGNWKNSKRSGYGKLYLKNRLIYAGNWKKGLQHGQGKYYFANGMVYAGEWSLGKINGKGTLYSSNETILYDGSWSNNRRHGPGYFSLPNGKFRAYWQDDQYIGKVEFIDNYNNPSHQRQLNDNERAWCNYGQPLVEIPSEKNL